MRRTRAIRVSFFSCVVPIEKLADRTGDNDRGSADQLRGRLRREAGPYGIFADRHDRVEEGHLLGSPTAFETAKSDVVRICLSEIESVIAVAGAPLNRPPHHDIVRSELKERRI